MKKYHVIKNVKITDETMELEIDNNIYEFNLSEISPRLKNAKKSERENFLVSPSGYGINWPAIDEDLSIDGLLGIKHEFYFQERKAAS